MQSATIEILQITDTHIGADPRERLGGVDTRESFLAVRDAVQASGIDYNSIWLTGDLTANSEPRAYQWLFNELRTLDLPVYCIPGNHDEAQTMASLVFAQGWQHCGELTIGGWHVVFLDSAVLGEAYGNLRAEELERLDASLVAHRDSPCVVVLHHNPIPMSSRWLDTMTLRNCEQFWAVLDRHTQMRCVVWGHVHQNFDTYYNGVRLLATPSTCVQFEARASDFAIAPLAPGYRRLTLSADGGISSNALRIRA
jgi:Icc protein